MSRFKSWLILGSLCVLAIVGFATLLMKEPELWRPPFVNGMARRPCKLGSVERENPFLVYDGDGKWRKAPAGNVHCGDYLLPGSFEETVQRVKVELAGWSTVTTPEGDLEVEQGRFAVRVYRKPDGHMRRVRVWNLFRMQVGKYAR